MAVFDFFYIEVFKIVWNFGADPIHPKLGFGKGSLQFVGTHSDYDTYLNITNHRRGFTDDQASKYCTPEYKIAGAQCKRGHDLRRKCLLYIMPCPKISKMVDLNSRPESPLWPNWDGSTFLHHFFYTNFFSKKFFLILKLGVKMSLSLNSGSRY